jgi:hypothetical protein
VPGNGLFDGPTNWKSGTSGMSMLKGPPSGPELPSPRLIRKNAREWPKNQPGCTAIAPPVTGHKVRLVVSGIPPPKIVGLVIMTGEENVIRVVEVY